MRTANAPDASSSKLPSISIIVEWENAKLSELGRALAMLREVSRQVAELRPRFTADPELIVIYDADTIDPASVQSALNNELSEESGLAVRLESMRGLDYYGQKNHGASVAQGDLIVFLDSDVVPEAGWLEALLRASEASRGGVAGGSTYLDPSTFLGRTFGLFWFFPLREASEAVVLAPSFFANSVVFPRRLFACYGFSPLGAVRGQCSALSGRLIGDGVPLVRAQGARASHPAPNGVSHLIRRALCEGHDARVLDRMVRSNGARVPNPLVRSAARLAHNSARATWRIVRHRRAVDMPVIEVPAALAVAGSYYLLFMVGEIVSWINPRVIPERLRV